MPSNFKALAGASGGEPTDANFKNVTLLLHGDGSNGAQNNTFIDSSTNNFTITRNGNTTQGSFSPYGSNWSNYFDGTGDYLSVADNAALQLGSSDFTIEFWVYFTALSGNTWIAGKGDAASSSGSSFSLPVNGVGTAFEFYYGSSSLAVTRPTFTTNTWHHVAVVRSGAAITIYLNGSSTASGNLPSSSTSLNTGGSNPVQIGSYAGGAVSGYISNFRIVKGTAVYTSAFTPSTTPLTAITNTSLLTCAYNRFRDGSTNNFTITRNGDVKVTNFSPFAPSAAYSTTTNGGSAYFDGSDWLSLDDSSAWDFGTGDFTIELWVYPLTSGTATGHAYVSNYAGSGSGWMLGLDSNGLRFSWGDSYVFSNSSVPTVGSWNHVAISRSGTSLKAFINGTQVGSTVTDSTNFTNSTGIRIGRLADGAYAIWYYNGYMSNIRVAKTAVYTANFTPPTSPVTAITNTQLLVNATNAAIFDNSMKNDLETVGNAQISTSVKKFGTGSMYFDGSGDYLIVPDSQTWSFGGDFTVETWVYPTSTPAEQVIISQWYGGGLTQQAWQISFVSGKAKCIVTIGSTEYSITSASTYSTNTWHHVAMCRSGSTLTLYVNGTSVGTASASGTTNDIAYPLVIGALNATGSYVVPFTGYIDDLRITKGVARYTANFTPPTAPFPNK